VEPDYCLDGPSPYAVNTMIPERRRSFPGHGVGQSSEFQVDSKVGAIEPSGVVEFPER